MLPSKGMLIHSQGDGCDSQWRRVHPFSITDGELQDSIEAGDGGSSQRRYPPLFRVDLAFVDGMDQLPSSDDATVDPSKLIAFDPPESDFRSCIEVSDGIS